MQKIDFSKANPNDFTQKDLMIHLLNVSQHTVTREDVSKLDKKIDKVEKNLENSISVLDQKIEVQNKRFDAHDKRFDKLEAKFDKLQWFLVAGALVILFKEQILKIIIAS